MSLIRRPLGVRESAALGESAADMGRCRRELASETGRERDFEEVRDRPDARREIAGDGGAGREEVREVTEWVLRRWLWSSVSWESNNRGGGSRKDVLGDSVVGVDSAPFGVAWPLLRPLAAVVTSSKSFFDDFLRANSCGPGVGGGRNEEPGDGNGGEERRAA